MLLDESFVSFNRSRQDVLAFLLEVFTRDTVVLNAADEKSAAEYEPCFDTTHVTDADLHSMLLHADPERIVHQVDPIIRRTDRKWKFNQQAGVERFAETLPHILESLRRAVDSQSAVLFFETNDKRTRCSDRMAASSQTSVPDARQRAKLGQKTKSKKTSKARTPCQVGQAQAERRRGTQSHLQLNAQEQGKHTCGHNIRYACTWDAQGH